jgi:hypothetical protein
MLSFVKGCVHLSFEFFLKMICYPEKIISYGVHNYIPEYASTAGISIAMTMTFHVKLFEKKFLKK